MQIKIMRFFLFFWFMSSLVFSQNKNLISGSIKHQENNEPLPFASITLKNSAIGTISNENGAFDFYIPKNNQKDTLVISYIGFNSYLIALEQIKNPLEIKLEPANNVLNEIVLSQFTPLDYIKKALENLEQNYPQDSYQSIAYYRQKFIENEQIINKEEAVFKTYYSKQKDTAKNQHQLLLYKPAENPQEFQFMREWIEKKSAKAKKKADKKGEVYEEDEYDGKLKADFGGPQTILNLDINQEKGNYLKLKEFKKYEYTFGDETSLNGEPLVTVLFKAKSAIDHIKDEGKILISRESYAIVSIESKGKFSIPFLIKPVLFAMGLNISNPNFKTTINYQKIADKWYPNLFRWDAKISLTKKHMFDANENSAVNVGQLFLINKIDSVGTPVSKEKLFAADKDLKDQVFNDLNLQWSGLNIVKD